MVTSHITIQEGLFPPVDGSDLLRTLAGSSTCRAQTLAATRILLCPSAGGIGVFIRLH